MGVLPRGRFRVSWSRLRFSGSCAAHACPGSLQTSFQELVLGTVLPSPGCWSLGEEQSSSWVTGGYWKPQPSLVEGLHIHTKS